MKKSFKKGLVCSMSGVLGIMSLGCTTPSDINSDCNKVMVTETCEQENDHESEQETVIATEVIEEQEVFNIYDQISAEYLELFENKDSYPSTVDWFIEYKTFIAKYEEFCDKPENIYDVFTYDELSYMARCIETECHGADFDSKVNVASVILNRIESETFPDNMKSVITASGQFAYSKKSVTPETILAMEYAYEIEDPTNGALFFNSSKKKKDKWFNANYIFTDAVGHHFYGF